MTEKIRSEGLVTNGNENRYYIDKEEMYNELVLYNQTGTVSERLHLMIYEMAERIATKGNFRNYTYIDDMVHHAYVRCLTYGVHNYKLELTNPFAYFTQIIFWAFLGYIKKEKKYQKKKWAELGKLVTKMEQEYSIKIDMSENIREKMYNALLKDEK